MSTPGECLHFRCIGPLACYGGQDEKPGRWRWVMCLSCGSYKQWDIEEKPYHYTGVAIRDESLPWTVPNRYRPQEGGIIIGDTTEERCIKLSRDILTWAEQNGHKFPLDLGLRLNNEARERTYSILTD